MTFPVTRQATLASLAMAIAAPSFAQTTAIDAVIVTATRSPQRASEVISDTVTITADEIARSGVGSVTELLQRQRGIEVTRNGGPGTNSTVYIRGANSNQNIVLVDGVRIGSSTSGAASWSSIPLSAIDRIEIVYGPLSTLYGADAIGGVIQVFTKKGKGETAVTAFAGAGSDNTREADAAISGGTGKFSYSLSAGKERSDGFSATKPGNFSYNGDKDGYDRKNAAGQFTVQLAPGHEAGALFLYSRTETQIDAGAGSFDAHSVQDLNNVAVFSRHELLPNWKMQLQLAQTRDKSGNFSGTGPFGTSQINTKQTQFSWQNDIQLGADTLQLLAERRKEEVEANTAGLSRDRSTNSVATTYNLKRGDHLVSVGARNDDSSQYGSKGTGSLGYGYRFTRELRLNASYGTSFRAPTFNELYYPGFGQPDNKPEKGRNGEIGLQYNDGKTQLGAVYYRNKLSRLLVTTIPCPIPDPAFTFGCAYNVNKATLEGLSLSAQHQLGDLALSASADLQDPKDETTHKQLARRARRHASLAAEYGAGPLRAGVEWQLSSERFDNASNTARLGGYGLVNLFATWQFNRDWSALVRWNNVADKQYELARYYATAGSTVFAGLRYGMK
ncbi:TonB-dependent receptor domain-containing protein [Massilia endophytica]|uniref:TonB-dependent receptor domain-containing protein n=1 Tax=Massilia endophytica TaxID=2899220 RepID=UPI001E5FB240|nr:TonB-dependent receptor [Massilia endophytica]UGQ47723.1 TonB-dependent receptor [Massilia endophytica]